MSPIVTEFVARYRREFDYFSEAGRLVHQQLQVGLQTSGFRGIVTFRAKSPDRLQEKLIQRAKKRGREYTAVEEIYADIVDLAGVRVALYFPADREEVGKLIQSNFNLVETPRHFPDRSSPPQEFTSVSGEIYKKRFSGYLATHYRVQLHDAALSEPQKRYADARVEIQVASVLMHAWSEVEHDLVYKPLEGPLSLDEYAILDELNGLVLSGEIALERLQKAGETRVKAYARRPFSNHYDLAAYLFEVARPLLKSGPVEPTMGRVDVLFDLLNELGLATPEGVSEYLKPLDLESESRPLAEQIIDRVIVADTRRYEALNRVRSQRDRRSPYTVERQAPESSDNEKAIGFFMAQWILFERRIWDMARQKALDTRWHTAPTPKVLRELNVFNEDTIGEVEFLRRLRNNLVHGVEVPETAYLYEAGEAIKRILEKTQTSSTGDTQQPSPNGGAQATATASKVD